MFDWLGDIISGIGSAIGDAIDFIGSGVGDAIWNAMLKWLYEIVYGAIADFFEMMGNMGSEVFDLEWVQATVKLFTLFGWGLFVAGTVVAVFDVAIEYQCGRANIKTTALNILKGFFACSLIGIVPIELYKFCIPRRNVLVGGFGNLRSFEFAVHDRLCLLRNQDVFRQYQAWRHSAHSNSGRFAVYVQRSPWLCGRLQSMVQAGYSDLPYGIYADNLVVPWTNDIPEQYAVGAWHYAGRQ